MYSERVDLFASGHLSVMGRGGSTNSAEKRFKPQLKQLEIQMFNESNNSSQTHDEH